MVKFGVSEYPLEMLKGIKTFQDLKNMFPGGIKGTCLRDCFDKLELARNTAKNVRKTDTPSSKPKQDKS